MKLCYLANASSVHTAKWANHFCRKGHEVEIISFDPPVGVGAKITTHIPGRKLPLSLHYFTCGTEVRRLISQIDPDIVHAHYVSGYGTVGQLADFHPYVLSVWGADIFEFPRQSPVHRELVRRNLASADTICSTSHFMAAETRRYCSQPILVTPFGVDCEQFRLLRAHRDNAGEFIIGTVKGLEPKYGVDYLMRSFAVLAGKYPRRSMRLVIAGDGTLRQPLRKLAKDLGLERRIDFLGKVPHEQVPRLLNTFSVFAALSVADSESFGVAVLEASACAIPVLVTSAGGLPEVVQHRKTGLVVPPRDVTAAADALEELMENELLRRDLGAAGRQFVLENYEWKENASRMECLYESLLHAGGNLNTAIRHGASEPRNSKLESEKSVRVEFGHNSEEIR